MFQVPPTTQYDLRFTLFGVPVRVHPLFWVMAILFGFSYRDLLLILIWVGVVFVSILIHELGHAFAMMRYGQSASIVLYHFGGLAIPGSSPWGGGSRDPKQQIFISFAGPLAGFVCAGIIMLMVILLGGSINMLPLPRATLGLQGFFGGLLSETVRMLLWVNIFWGLLNLIPVLPLDGGNISRSIFTMNDPWNGMRKALWVSVVAGALAALLGLVFLGSIYIAILFGFLAYQSYVMLKGRGVGSAF